MSKKTVHPHNAFFMALMDNPEAFAAYMVLHIPPEEYSQYDWKIEQGIERGQHQGLMTADRNMLQQGFDVETIAKCLSIDEEEVRLIQKDLS